MRIKKQRKNGRLFIRAMGDKANAIMSGKHVGKVSEQELWFIMVKFV